MKTVGKFFVSVPVRGFFILLAVPTPTPEQPPKRFSPR